MRFEKNEDPRCAEVFGFFFGENLKRKYRGVICKQWLLRYVKVRSCVSVRNGLGRFASEDVYSFPNVQ